MMQALMARFHGHPYDTLDLLPYNVVDPVKKTPLENLWAMGHNRNELVSFGCRNVTTLGTSTLSSCCGSQHTQSRKAPVTSSNA